MFQSKRILTKLIRNKSKLSLDDITNFQPSTEEVNQYYEKQEQLKMEKQKKEEELKPQLKDAFPQDLKIDGTNRIKTLSTYRRIGKLIKNMIKTKESFEKTFGMVREEYKQNKSLSIQEEINQAISHAEVYIERLGASTRAKENSSTLTDKQSRRSAYWNEYYKNESSVEEWYCNFNTVTKYLPFLSDAKVMVLGCGISALGGRLLFK